MNLSAHTLTDATEAAGALLEALGLEAYLFEVEPRENTWEMRVECAHGGGWQSIVLPLDVDALLASRMDETARARLVEEWRQRLAACRRRRDER
jgi:hypothetical protein